MVTHLLAQLPGSHCITLSLSLYHYHFITITVSLSLYHYHCITITVTLIKFHLPERRGEERRREDLPGECPTVH